MPAERKLTDDELGRVRVLSADGWSHADLAAAFGVSAQHVGRLVRGEQRPVIGAQGAEDAAGGVSEAVATFLDDAELSTRDVVLAATARALAAKLDACAASEAATAAQAAPRLAAQLVDVLSELHESLPREPDALDVLRQRRQMRLAAAAASVNTPNNGRNHDEE
jgi:hypothetical protein